MVDDIPFPSGAYRPPQVALSERGPADWDRGVLTQPAGLEVPWSDDDHQFCGDLANSGWAFRAKVQDFQPGGFEVVVSKIDIGHLSFLKSLPRHRGPRVTRRGTELSIEASCRRAKRQVRYLVKNIGADHLMTLTTRQDENTVAQLAEWWSKFVDLFEYATGDKLAYVCTSEPHPTNPKHFHLHVAVRGRVKLNLARQCWWNCCGGRGMGNVDVKYIKVPFEKAGRRSGKIASYLSKYITKDLIERFNKKRYWASHCDLPAARKYWLRARHIIDAIQEIRDLLGIDEGPGLGLMRGIFHPPGSDMVWFARFAGDEVRAPPF